MDSALLNAIGELLLNAVPTVIIFLILVAGYNRLVYRPMMKVLEERRVKTEGAVARAQADIAAAEAKSADYEQRLREARASVFKQMENRRKQHMEARAAVIAAAKTAASQKVQAAKADIEKEAEQAKAALGTQSEALAQEIIQAVLQDASSVPMAGARG
jgi:F-type H+-transporting ATPase subunit b